MMGRRADFAWRWVLRGMDLPQGQPLPVKDRLRATARAFWAMLMPIIIIGGMKTVCSPHRSRRGGRVLCADGGVVHSPRNARA